MGLHLGCISGGSYYDCDPPKGDPDPKKFNVVRFSVLGTAKQQWTVAEVTYPNCTNYEGRKIMVYRGDCSLQLITATYLDPHFTNDDNLSPVARFEPTEEGWAMAEKFAKGL